MVLLKPKHYSIDILSQYIYNFGLLCFSIFLHAVVYVSIIYLYIYIYIYNMPSFD